MKVSSLAMLTVCGCAGVDDGSSAESSPSLQTTGSVPTPSATTESPPASPALPATAGSPASTATSASSSMTTASASAEATVDHSSHIDEEADPTATSATPPTTAVPPSEPDTAPPSVTSPIPSMQPSANGGSSGDTGLEATGGMGGSTPVTEELEGLLAFGPPGVPAEEMCGFCHGVNGEGTTLAPEIQHPVEDFATWVIRNGREHPDFEEPMPEYGEDVLSEQLLSEIFVFLQSFPQPTTGEGLFLDHCANCHGVDARGGVTMRDISAEGPDHLLPHVREGAHPGEFDNRREYMHAYTADELSDEQVQLIAEHIQSL